MRRVRPRSSRLRRPVKFGKNEGCSTSAPTRSIVARERLDVARFDGAAGGLAESRFPEPAPRADSRPGRGVVMNVAVCVKQIPDPAVPGSLSADHTLDRSGKLILDESDSYGV